jgi:2-polyprenyl-3-methyl-5-hydroxy-6-metoxy-1,4-benzoquinol methylase
MKHPKSKLQAQPKSKILKKGYINTYSQLTPQEQRQIDYKTKYHLLHPVWDETMVWLSHELGKRLKKNAVVLDAGCGNGSYLIDENRTKIAWAVGVDISADFVKKNIGLDQIKISNLEKLPFADESFDVVVSLWVLEHLEHPDQVLSEVNRVLKPGGVFLFATPNKNFLPLFAVKALEKLKLNHVLNKKLFGRDEADIFQTYYRANTVSEVQKLAKSKFKIQTLKYNFDPSYLSFNPATFVLSNGFHKIASLSRATVTFPHIVGILEKKS